MGNIVVANWKMNGSLAFIQTFLPSLKEILATTSNQIIICPPFPYLHSVAHALHGTNARLGAQNCHPAPQGAFTGEVSALMLADMGCQAVIVGHSERRVLFAENDTLVRSKAAAVHDAGMTAIVCVGESLTIRKSGQAINTVIQHLQKSLPSSATPSNTFIAYEPTWAIGTGLTASPQDITEMHQALHTATQSSFPLLYGGSVTDQNATNILSLAHVDGILVGGSSLKIEAFQTIANTP